MMQERSQRTISRRVEVTGIGFLTGADIRLQFHPAAPDQGIAFLRTDCLDSRPIPARVEYTVARQRRTAIECHGVAVEMVEHVLAALAGLQIDNCLVTLDAPEPPGCDGSSLTFAQALCDAGIEEQGVRRELLRVRHPVCVRNEDRTQSIRIVPNMTGRFSIRYGLDYGPDSPIPLQEAEVDINPETFLRDLSFARTFLLSSEAEQLRAAGYGRRTTARDLLIFGNDGIVDNSLRAPNECARHKLLDCLGDLALLGCDVAGSVEAWRSGHSLNAELARRIQLVHGRQRLSASMLYAA